MVATAETSATAGNLTPVVGTRQQQGPTAEKETNGTTGNA
jgi:hypothetical protein